MSMFYELMMRKKEEIMYATIKGSLTESPSGVFSGFEKNANYLQIDNIPFSSNIWEIVIRANHTAGNSTLMATNNDGRNGLLVLFGNKQITVYLKRGGGADQTLITASVEGLTDNNFHYIKLQRQYNDLILSYSEDGINYSVLNTVQPQSFIPDSNICLGGGSYWSTAGFGGAIDLNRSYIKLGSTKYNLQAVVGYTVVGSPTIVDGVISGFSTSDYLSINTAGKISSADTWEMCFKLGTSTTGYFLGSNVADVVTYSPARSQLYLSSNGTSWDIASGIGTDSPVPDNCYLRIKFTGTQYIAEYSTDKISWIATSVVNSSVKIVNFANLYIGKWQSSYYRGSIDMNKTYIKVNGKLLFNGQQA